MRRTAIMLAGFVIALTLGATAQENRSEISLQGFNRWLSAEGNYGYDRNTQKYFAGFGESRVQANVHTVTGDVALNLPLPIKRISTYVLAGGGGLIFDPTRNIGGFVPGADTQGRGAFLYGAGADYVLSRHFSLRGEYRGFVYKNPDFGVRALNTDSWTHTAQPSAGIAFRF